MSGSDADTRDQVDLRTDSRTETHHSGLDEGIGIALKAEEDGHQSPLTDWLAHHPELAGELASFLAANRGLRSAFGPARRIAGDGPGATWASVAGFELREELGRGGMGVVYRAYDTVLKREVALKRVLTGPHSSANDQARFRFEAEAVASLDHPAIVRVHASGESDGTPFLVMPLMEGGSLAGRLRSLGPDRNLPGKEAARLIREIALGVHHAHQRGLIHRDLKPANILLDREGRPHVADFGLARSIRVGPTTSVSGGVVGTAAYMAPEQARGEKALTTAVDVHALGAILHELLVGTPPFGNDAWLAVLKRVQDEDAPSIRRLRPDVPRDLESIALRCLAKRPEDRYASALELAEELTRFLDGEPLGVVHRRVWITNLSRAVRRRRETPSMTTWVAFFWAAAVVAVAQLVVQGIVLSKVSGVWAYAALGANLVGWMILYGWFFVLQMAGLSPVERNSAAFKLGLMLATLALIPAHLAQHGPEITPLYQPMTVVLGLTVFAHGATHWGRLFLVGLLILATSAAMPLVPRTYWPTTYAITCVVAFVWVGFRFRAFDLEARTGSLTRLDEPADSAPTRAFTPIE